MIGRMDHERSRQETIAELENKIREIKELAKTTKDDKLEQYYKAYMRAYADCIEIINRKW